MKRTCVAAVVLTTALALSLAACAPAASTPASAPTKAVDYPTKGKAITFIVTGGAGGATDIGARTLAPALEKELGTSIEVVNKGGSGGQVGLTDLVRSKPDGYTISITSLPTAILTYLDPERQAVFARKDFQPVANHVIDPVAIAVKSNSPYGTLKDLVDAAVANPQKVTVTSSGLLSNSNLAFLMLQQKAGAQFAILFFDDAGPQRSALLGGHVNAEGGSVSELLPGVKSGDLRVLAVFDDQESPFLPGVKTAKAQGYDIVAGAARGISVPAGTPPGVVDTLSRAIKKVTETEEHKARIKDMGLSLRYMDASQYAEYWDKLEPQMKGLFDQTKKK